LCENGLVQATQRLSPKGGAFKNFSILIEVSNDDDNDEKTIKN
jgi:hypothetical protein